MATDALMDSRPSNVASTLVGVAAVILAGAAVVYLVDRQEARKVDAETRSQVIENADRADLEAQWLQRAIRDRQAMLGMTASEVEMAKGRPYLRQRGDTLPDVHRAKGGVENWIYDLGSGEVSGVLFGSDGLVIHASDVAGKVRYGHAIRQ